MIWYVLLVKGIVQIIIKEEALKKSRKSNYKKKFVVTLFLTNFFV